MLKSRNSKKLAVGSLIVSLAVLMIYAIFIFLSVSPDVTETNNVTAVPDNSIELPDTASLVKLTVSSDTLSYFNDIALGSEYGDDEARIRKWTKPNVTITVNGNMTESDDVCLSTVISDFNSLSSETKLSIAQNSSDITLNFAPESTFKSIEPNYEPINLGFFWVNINSDMSINRSNILISTTGLTDTERCHLIREELTQSTGLMKDSQKYVSSMFYGGWTTTDEYSDLDEQLIKILYGGTGILPNDSLEDVTSKVIVDQ